MKVASGTPVHSAISQAYNLVALPQLIAEWNYNRYVDTVVDNNPTEAAEGQDSNLFPIDSIVANNRPPRGIVKARIGQSRVSKNYAAAPDAARYYVCSDDDIYKYWSSPQPTNATLSGGGYGFDVGFEVQPYVVYGTLAVIRTVVANKIVICFETTYSTPVTYTINANIGGVWTAIGTQATFPIGSNGRIVMYRQAAGSWGTTVDRTSSQVIGGVQVVVTKMDKSNAYCEVIEISARLEQDLTPYLVNVNDNVQLSDPSFITPLGKASTGTGTLTLFNDLVDEAIPSKGLLFNQTNVDSPYYQLVDSNTKFSLSYLFDCTAYGGGSAVAVKQFEMYATSEWQGQRQENISVPLQDYSKYLQDLTPRKAFYENLSAAEIIWRLLDSVGFSDYQIDMRDDDNITVIPLWWSDGQKTVWQIISELAERWQMAIYFDCNGTLQIKTRRQAYNEAGFDWTLRGVDSGVNLANIVDYTQTEDYEANSVKVHYQKTEFSDFNKGFPKMSQVWSPDGTVVLRAANLLRDLNSADSFIWMPPADARIWPFDGIIQVEGELIKYHGKQYIWYNAAGARQTTLVKSEDQLKDINQNKSADLQRHKNHFSGGLFITDRGLWNTEKKFHGIKVSGYAVRALTPGGVINSAAGFRQIRKNSVVRMSQGKGRDTKNWLVATRGASSDSGFYYYGARIKIRKVGQKHGFVGLCFHNNGAPEQGYFVELVPSKYLDGKIRKTFNELNFYAKTGTSSITRLGPNKTRGIPVRVVPGEWYNLDVSYTTVGSDQVVTIFLNGVKAMTVTIPTGAAYKQPFGGKFGLFVRGNTTAEFEYLYAISRPEGPSLDGSEFFDKIAGGFVSYQWDREWVWRTRDDNHVKKNPNDNDKERYSQRFFDEFGPICHEVRQFEVKFNPAPVLHSRLYVSNDSQVVCPEYTSDAFGATFVLANASRENAVVNGEDSLPFAGSGSTVNQILTIFGRAVIERKEKTVKVTNDNAIKKRGKIETEFSNTWIESKEEAQSLGQWIVDHWSQGADECEVPIFGNPILELCDVVKIDWPQKSMSTATHKYFIVGTSTTFDSGLSTTLTLRRCKI